ncbi:uncharacterized protein LOC129239654 [Anastrepha obliqua]|uniref:uncharacterized protein LOC129239654 n=1 Tax=Anastrepha obliqua TaxID=95512 RepID=UPI00240A5FBF|nr:uncharacterized protein LOC129239654 [Anastrepha obliqua]XP_054731294.1 uncharacterized protein LOC129239654 [Anastrepha obliqua]XP_054731295.1 uncharacterized protein LOC129239654 [Anastrepha obliqua]
MRVGKKANVVEAKKTRSCVVRLEKVSSPPIKATRSSGVSPRGNVQIHSDEKKFKGPLKKRPIAQGSSPAASPNTATPSSTQILAKAKEMKDRFKTPLKGVKSESAKRVADEQPSPTIAAGRSRRAIKPNPKYASEDMVTPKSIRNVAALAGTSVKRPVITAKQRKRSTSSSDDFFNRDSSDELGANELDDEVDKIYKAIEKETDSDFSDEPKVVETQVKRRGRPRKNTQSTPTSTPTPTPRPTATPRPTSTSTPRPPPPTVLKGQASQLQLLRKSFAASVNRSIEPLAGIKRPRIDSVTGGSSSDNDADAGVVARKRFLLSKSAIVRANKNSNSSDISVVARKTNQTLNGSKINKIKPGIIDVEQHKRNTTVSEKRTLMDANSAPIRIQQQAKPLHTMRNVGNTSTTPLTRTLITMPSKTQNARVMAVAKRRSASPATPKVTKTVIEEKAEESSGHKLADSPSTTVDDFETMPTFTIVNINDIINKKGDVLISKTGKSQKPDDSITSDNDLSEQIKMSEPKNAPGRHKGSIVDKYSDAIHSKSPLISTRKPTQKILNHTLLKKLSSSDSASQRSKANSSISPDKPAPRILNAMVAKKTQPVKPMIANFEDSADDETYPLSLDGDEEEEEDDAEEDTGDAEEDDEDPDDSFEVSKNKLPTSTPYLVKKRTPSAKENSQTALNRQPTKNVIQRKISPEKVVISRQGDKIIKKITCFETWYVIIPEETTPKVTRNILDIPLIKLANVATEIKLPSEDWKSKVTLHELSPTMIAKSNLITYTGDLNEYNIAENDRGRYQPSCVMFRRSVNDRAKSRLPYDRAVIFKNKTFFTNIEGKNVKLVGAPSAVNSQKDVEILLQIVDSLTLQSSLVEPTNTMQ